MMFSRFTNNIHVDFLSEGGNQYTEITSLVTTTNTSGIYELHDKYNMKMGKNNDFSHFHSTCIFAEENIRFSFLS